MRKVAYTIDPSAKWMRSEVQINEEKFKLSENFLLVFNSYCWLLGCLFRMTNDALVYVIKILIFLYCSNLFGSDVFSIALINDWLLRRKRREKYTNVYFWDCYLLSPAFASSDKWRAIYISYLLLSTTWDHVDFNSITVFFMKTGF